MMLRNAENLMVERIIVFLQQNYTLFLVVCGTSIVGITAGMLGTFALLRKQSLMGDTIAHACLPGIAYAFLLMHSKNSFWLLIGAYGAAGLAIVGMSIITFTTRLKRDALLGIILSVFFGFGLVLMTVIQKKEIADQGFLHTFIFGNAATILPSDLCVISVI